MAPYTVGRSDRLYKLIKQNSIDISGLGVPLSNEMPGEGRFTDTDMLI